MTTTDPNPNPAPPPRTALSRKAAAPAPRNAPGLALCLRARDVPRTRVLAQHGEFVMTVRAHDNGKRDGGRGRARSRASRKAAAPAAKKPHVKVKV